MQRLLWLVVAFAPLSSALAACGGSSGQLSVKLDGGGDYKAGDAPEFVVTVTNDGPGDAPGVVIHVDMPGNFRYKATGGIDAHGQARTTLLDAKVGSSTPTWGLWNLGAPTLQNGQLTKASVAIPFTVDIEASPSTYTLAAHTSGDNTPSEVLSSPISVKVNPAPRLDVTASVSTKTLKAGDKTTYTVTVNNTGSDIAGNVGVLITLPPVMTFQNSVTPFRGNATRNNAVDPVRGSVLVFYSGFVIPPASSAGPGFVAIAFIALAAPHPATGTFPLNIQVTDALLDVVTLSNAAPVVIAGGTASPGATPAPTVTPSPG